MGKNKDRAADLDARLSAATTLCRSVGEMVGVTIAEDITIHNVHRYIAAFSSALASRPRGRADGLAGGNLDTFDDDVDREIDRMEAANPGVTRPYAPGERTRHRPPEAVVSAPGAMVVRHSVEPAEADVYHPHHEGVLGLIARELGINIAGLPMEEALRDIHRELIEIKNPGDVGGGDDDGGPLAKGDTMREAVNHYRRAASTLHARAGQDSLILQRVAGALQVSQWDADGSEILEKAQRLDGIRLAIKRRIADVQVMSDDRFPDAGMSRQFVIDELNFLLTRLMGKAELAKWMQNKPRSAATSELAAVADAPPVKYPHEFSLGMVKVMGEIASWPTNKTDQMVAMATILADIAGSAVASDEMVKLINLVILPIVARVGTGGR